MTSVSCWLEFPFSLVQLASFFSVTFEQHDAHKKVEGFGHVVASAILTSFLTPSISYGQPATVASSHRHSHSVDPFALWLMQQHTTCSGYLLPQQV